MSLSFQQFYFWNTGNKLWIMESTNGWKKNRIAKENRMDTSMYMSVNIFHIFVTT